MSSSNKKSPTSVPLTPPPAPSAEVEKELSVGDRGGGDNDDQSEYEEIDLTENPLYQVLSAFFENEKGENLVDHLSKLTLAVENNTKMLEQVLTGKCKKNP